jgi:nicotinamidase/pyrazinamidase
MKKLYLDVDTQLDFVSPAGALYVPGAEKILHRIGALNREAIAGGHALIATMDAHTENDPEFQIYPHHCVKGTLGQRKAEATIVAGAQILEKVNVNCFTNPALEAMLGATGSKEAIVYGVVTEICVFHAAMGLIDRGWAVSVLTDAVMHLNSEKRDAFFADFRARGGRLA